MVKLRHVARYTGLVLLAAAGCFTAKNTAPPPGDVTRFDPIASFAAIAAYAGPEAKLVSMHAYFVRVDGTMDLTAEYRPHVDAEFVTKATPEDVEAQGPLAPGSGFSVGDVLRMSMVVRKPQTYHVTSGGSEWDEKHLGMGRTPAGKASGDEKTIAAPQCGFALLWQKAIENGAPKDVVANITYNGEGYRFKANGRDFEQRFAADCSPIGK